MAAQMTNEISHGLDNGYDWRHRQIGLGSEPSNLYSVSDSFKKKIELPHIATWDGINRNFMRAANRLLVFEKRQYTFWSSYSNPEMRPVYLTNDRFLLIYTHINQGYLFDLRAAHSIKVRMKERKINNGAVCHMNQIKLKFDFGNLYLITRSNLVLPIDIQWRTQMEVAFGGSDPKNADPTTEAKIAPPPSIEPSLQHVPILSSEANVELDEPQTMSEYCASEIRNKGNLTSTEADSNGLKADDLPSTERRDVATNMPSISSSLERVRRFFLPSRGLDIKNSFSATSNQVTEDGHGRFMAVSEEDSTNSGFLSDFTSTEISCRANPNLTVVQLREQLEAQYKANRRVGLFGRFLAARREASAKNGSESTLRGSETNA